MHRSYPANHALWDAAHGLQGEASRAAVEEKEVRIAANPPPVRRRNEGVWTPSSTEELEAIHEHAKQVLLDRLETNKRAATAIGEARPLVKSDSDNDELPSAKVVPSQKNNELPRSVAVNDPLHARARELINGVCETLRQTLLAKNEDYHSSFARPDDTFSGDGAETARAHIHARMGDKLKRIKSLRGGKEANVAESLADTKLDLAGYLLLERVLEQLIAEGLVK